jgi:hypothetical protein
MEGFNTSLVIGVYASVFGIATLVTLYRWRQNCKKDKRQ